MKDFLYSLSKTWLGGLGLYWIFSYLAFMIPGERLVEKDSLLAFFHPSPSYSLHILIVPRGRFQSLRDLPSPDLLFEKELFEAVGSLVERFGLEERGYRLIVNGGAFQDVGHLHIHLISESAALQAEQGT